ncbi:MAG TPA: PIN domain-containing protein [Gemmatales bacterium]|nr:PIN domain-containing protein [Gemmatales bacterium]
MNMQLLDTNIVSFFFKEDQLEALYFPLIVGRDAVVSFQTVAEMKEGSIAAGWSRAKQLRLEHFLDEYPVIHTDDNMCNWWGWVRAIRKAQPISATDAWIAATALSYDIELVTHNPKDFRGIPGLRVLTATT